MGAVVADFAWRLITGQVGILRVANPWSRAQILVVVYGAILVLGLMSPCIHSVHACEEGPWAAVKALAVPLYGMVVAFPGVNRAIRKDKYGKH